MSVNRVAPEIQNASPKSLLFDGRFQTFNINHSDDDGGSRRRAEENNSSSSISRYSADWRKENSLEAMFEKPLTPSDVGKLNRLVIPKQHAERHLPLGGDDSKVTLLSFEDEAGKLWRFRYSYWNSSQSYVFTKGWSRYVKEKRLEAGDVVLFERHPSDPGRLFIGWRRRHNPSHNDHSNTKWAVAVCSHQSQPDNHPESSSPAEGVSQRRNASSGTLRLFGVNLEYQFGSDGSEPATPDGSSTSSPGDQVRQQDASHRQPRR